MLAELVFYNLLPYLFGSVAQLWLYSFLYVCMGIFFVSGHTKSQKTCIFMHLSPDSVGRCIMLSGCPSTVFICLSICLFVRRDCYHDIS